MLLGQTGGMRASRLVWSLKLDSMDLRSNWMHRQDLKDVHKKFSIFMSEIRISDKDGELKHTMIGKNGGMRTSGHAWPWKLVGIAVKANHLHKLGLNRCPQEISDFLCLKSLSSTYMVSYTHNHLENWGCACFRVCLTFKMDRHGREGQATT